MIALRNDKGVAIMTVMFFLIIVTILAVGAITLSTVQVVVSGGYARAEMQRSAQEGTMNFAYQLVRDHHYAQNPKDVQAYDFYVQTTVPTLWNEVRDQQSLHFSDSVNATPNVTTSVGNYTVDIDIDALGSAVSPGGSIEASSGYLRTGAQMNGFRITVLNPVNGSTMTQVIWLKSITN